MIVASIFAASRDFVKSIGNFNTNAPCPLGGHGNMELQARVAASASVVPPSLQAPMARLN